MKEGSIIILCKIVESIRIENCINVSCFLISEFKYFEKKYLIFRISTYKIRWICQRTIIEILKERTQGIQVIFKLTFLPTSSWVTKKLLVDLLATILTFEFIDFDTFHKQTTREMVALLQSPYPIGRMYYFISQFQSGRLFSPCCWNISRYYKYWRHAKTLFSFFFVNFS